MGAAKVSPTGGDLEGAYTAVQTAHSRCRIFLQRFDNF